MNDPIRRTWAGRTAAEYRSAAVSAEMLHWLVQLAVSPDTLVAANRVVADELVHAEASLGVFVAAGGHPSMIRVERSLLSLVGAPGETLERRALYAALEEFALHETFALAAFLAMRPRATEPCVAEALERITRDEARHRVFGWDLLVELLDVTGERVWLVGQLDVAVRRVTEMYAGAAEPSEVDRRWGLLGPADYDLAMATCLADVVTPRLHERGLLPG